MQKMWIQTPEKEERTIRRIKQLPSTSKSFSIINEAFLDNFSDLVPQSLDILEKGQCDEVLLIHILVILPDPCLQHF